MTNTIEFSRIHELTIDQMHTMATDIIHGPTTFSNAFTPSFDGVYDINFEGSKEDFKKWEESLMQ